MLARDCVASIRRWAARDGLGQMLMTGTDELSAITDRQIRFRLKQPFPLLRSALGKASSPVPFMMPERLAAISAATQLREALGSGPFRFLPAEWVPGSSAAFVRFDGYVPRNEPPNGAAGGKVMHVDRVEWRIIPDPATAAAALRRSEVDWYEQPDLDLVPLLRASSGIVVDSFYDGFAALMRFNQLHAPFNNIRVRQAILAAVDQSDYLMTRAPQPDEYLECKSYFFCGTPMSTGAGSGAMTADLKRAKALLSASGYGGEKVVIISPTDIHWLQAVSTVTEDMLRKLGMNVELSATDLGTFFARRNSPETVSHGGWGIFHTGLGSVDVTDPATHIALRGNGRAGWPGWPTDPELQRLRLDWMQTADPVTQLDVARQVERRAFDTVPYVPLGIRRNFTASGTWSPVCRKAAPHLPGTSKKAPDRSRFPQPSPLRPQCSLHAPGHHGKRVAKNKEHPQDRGIDCHGVSVARRVGELLDHLPSRAEQVRDTYYRGEYTRLDQLGELADVGRQEAPGRLRQDDVEDGLAHRHPERPRPFGLSGRDGNKRAPCHLGDPGGAPETDPHNRGHDRPRGKPDLWQREEHEQQREQ